MFKSTHTEDILKVLKPMQTRGDKMYIPETLTESFADHPIKKRMICLGFKECPIKNYISNDGISVLISISLLSKLAKKGSTCAGDPSYTECKLRRHKLQNVPSIQSDQ